LDTLEGVGIGNLITGRMQVGGDNEVQKKGEGRRVRGEARRRFPFSVPAILTLINFYF
jgi:hypothetical protein